MQDATQDEMQTKPRALIVDDEKQMTAIVAFALETQGFECNSVNDATQALHLIARQRYQIIVLDVLMPNISGIELTRRIRALPSDTPIILLTALGEEEHRIKGLEAGADDYVTKPFSPRELALRAQAIVRRSSPQSPVRIMKIGALTIDKQRVQALWQNELLTESLTEVRLLWTLAQAEDEIVPTRTLISRIWNTTDPVGGKEMLKTTVYRLRKKMQQAGIDTNCIESHRSLGYALNSGILTSEISEITSVQKQTLEKRYRKDTD